MKKRIVSLVLVAAMILSFVPKLVVPAYAAAAQMTEAEAWSAGLDVYTAWYNHVRRASRVKEYYDASNFSLLYNAVFEDIADADKKTRAAYEYLEDHFDFASNTELLQFNTYMTLLYACFYYYNEDDESISKSKNQNYTLEQLYDISDYMSDDFLQKVVDALFVGAFEKMDADNIPSDFLIATEKLMGSMDISELLDDSIGALGNTLGAGFSIFSAAKEASKFVNLNLLNDEFLEILRHLSENAYDPQLKSAASTLYDMVLENTNQQYKQIVIPYEAGNAVQDILLSEAISVGIKAFVEMAGSSAVAGGASVAVGGYTAAAVAATLIGIVICQLAEPLGKDLLDFLIGAESKHAANLDMYFMNIIRTSLYSTYNQALSNFNSDPNVENARWLNAVAKLMFNVLLCENHYAGLCEEAYCTAGLLQTGWAVDLMQNDAYSAFMEQISIRDETLNARRNEYTSDALAAYSSFIADHIHTVVFDTTGGDYALLTHLGLSAKQMKIDTIPLTLPAVAPTKAGHKFIGWATAPEGNAVYELGSKYTADEAATLYAVWETIPTITYDANGGKNPPAAHENTGSTALSSKEPTWFAHEFLGWAESASATSAAYQPGDILPKTGDVTLYAVWEQLPVITYNANGGDAAPDPQVNTVGDTTLSAKWPQRTGYVFVGWSVNDPAPGDDAALYGPGGRLPDEGDVTLYAIWRQAPAITYDANGGDPESIPAPHENTEGDTTLSAKWPQRTGYVFVGWSVNDPAPVDDATLYGPGGRLPDEGDVTLYAIWRQDAAPVFPKALSGTIKDGDADSAQYGQPLADVTVELYQNGALLDTATTGSDGSYSFTFSQAGTYQMVCSKTGYEDLERASVIVADGTTALGTSVMMLAEESAPPISGTVIDEGACGDDLTWTLYENGTMVIEGTGAMDDYNSSNAPWQAYKEQIKSVSVEDSVTSIGEYAFAYCDWLDNVYLGRSLKKLGNYSFGYCGKLKTITVPDNLTVSFTPTSSHHPFCGTLVTTVIVPDTTTSVSENLYNMPSIAVFETMDTDGYGYFDDDGILYYKDPYYETQTLVKCPESMNLTGTYSVLEGTHVIGAKGFCNMDRVKNVELPDGLTEVRNEAFYDCDLLETVEIPDSITSLGSAAFSNCDFLKEAYFHGNAPSIGSYAFSSTASGFTIYYIEGMNGWSTPTWQGYNAQPFSAKVKYEIADMTLTDDKGEALSGIPDSGGFWMTVHIKNLASASDSTVVIAAYGANGQFLDLCCAEVADLPVGATVKVGFLYDNKNGAIHRIKAFCVDALGNLIPLGDAVEIF